ncbi:MAG: 16S rRNA (guanine(527)-N(7))-methyltransferase RsmG [Bacteroidales bacterium]|nr:16S rRNA (guanine(527)-N(7))-methyltransferase RsmG [Bacteroidales bacterium]
MHIIKQHFPALSPLQKEQFHALQPLYEYWNARINVISRKDAENLYLHHVLHSLAIAKIIDFKPGTVILDAGTGGGFPGVPLAIYFPLVQFILMDSIAKKMKVVEAVIRELKLENCIPLTGRVEKLNNKVDFVVVRAVTDMATLLKWTGKNIRPGGNNTLKNGLLALKGGELDEELKAVSSEVNVFNISDYFGEPFFETKKVVYVEGVVV